MCECSVRRAAGDMNATSVELAVKSKIDGLATTLLAALDALPDMPLLPAEVKAAHPLHKPRAAIAITLTASFGNIFSPLD
jgi:hypothetical protein